MKSQPRDHLARGDKQQKRLPRHAALEAHECFDRAFIHTTTKAVDSLRRVGENLSGSKMSERSLDGRFHFLRRSARHEHRLRNQSLTILRASVNASSTCSV